jgi:hypothetical protein
MEAYSRAATEQNTDQIFKMYEKLNVARYTQKIQSAFFEKGLSDLENVKGIETVFLKNLATDLMARDY